MMKSKPKPDGLASLRKKAEKKLKKKAASLDERSAGDVRRLVQELETHQIELEMQNEELRRAQEELEASRSKYAELYDFAPIGYFTFDARGLIREVNLTGAGLLGFSKGLLVDKPFSRFIAQSSDRELFHAHRRDVLKERTTQACAIRLKKKDGTVFYAQLQSIAGEDAEGKISLCRTAVSDVTERKRAEEALRESEAGYRSLFENMIDGFALHKIVLDGRGKPVDYVFLEVNSAFERLAGLKRINILGKKVTEALPGIEKDPADWIGAYGSVALTGKELRFERYSELLGKWFKVSSYSPMKDHFVAVFEDITSRKGLEDALKKSRDELEIRVRERTAELVRANEALSRSEKLTRIVLDMMPIGVWLVDATGKIVEGNPAGRRIWAGARYVGIDQYGEYKGWRVGTGKRIEPEEWAAARAIRNGETSIDEEIEIECFDGTHKIILNSALPIRNERQKIAGAIIVNQDITERKEIETRTEITNKLLKLFTQKVTRQAYLDQALELIRAWSRCRCAGIRILHANGDIPYEAYTGFSREFWESECSLSIHKDQCACIRVISEHLEPQDASAKTRAGSFYSNNSMQFVAGLTEAEQARFRGVCVSSGFTSVAVIPIRYHDRILGAIHLADEREGMVPLAKIEFAEVLAFIIGEALYKYDVESELRKNYELLKENNELLENVFSNIHVMIAYLDTEFNFVRVNRTYAEADGRTPEFYPGRNHFDLYPNEDNEAIFRRVVETGEPYFAYEKPFVYAEHPERGVTYWDWSLVPVRESDGRIIGVMMSLIDVTGRKLAEVERDRLAAAVGATADAVAITEPLGGLIQYVNPAFERITGYARDEVVGCSLHILDSGKQDAAFYQELRETLQRDGVWRGTLINKKKDGTLYFEECTYSPVRDPSGKIMNYVSVKRDVTDKLRLESIAESVNTMENIGYVFSGVRHEIGNPINTAKMILSVLQRKLDKSTKEDIGGQIDRTMTEIGRVEYLLKSLKNFNLYESLDIQVVDMEAFLTRFLSLVAEDYDRKNIKIRTDLGPEATRAFADPRALQHVLLNVFSNAADALEGRDDPAILITVSKRNGRIHLGVADNGSGMSEAQQKDLFKPFYTSKNHGTGLGLVIVKKMLAKMNGTIEVTSVQDRGTTVDIALPEGRDGTGY